jgi:hypothetical protein
MSEVDFLVLYEHPEWQKPLLGALEARGHRVRAFDLEAAAFDPAALPPARVVFNQASPGAYVRGHGRAVPFALSLLRAYEAAGVPVVNGHRAFSLELSKTAQVALLSRLGLRAPRTVAFHRVEALAAHLEGAPFTWPALIKPDQGGSGARMHRVESLDEVRELLAGTPSLFSPDPVLLLQELLPIDPERGIVRLELLGGELLYAMRVVSGGAFNLCPSEVCHPVDGAPGVCATPAPAAPAIRFSPYPEVPAAAVAAAERIVAAGGLDVAGLEYAEVDGEAVFYDLNANSNLRPAVAEHFGFDPFERVVDFLEGRLAGAASRAA